MRHWFSQTLQQTIPNGSTHPKGSTKTNGQLNDNCSGNAILVGADCPTLDNSVILETTQRLKDHDLVLGPAVDGGYYLIAMRGPWRESYQALFDDIPWSTDRVLEITKQRASDNGMSLALLQQREDIDTADALDRLCESLRADDSDSECRRLLTEITAILADDAAKETLL